MKIYTSLEEEKLIKELRDLVSKFKRVNQVIQRQENKHLLNFIIFKTPKLFDPVYNNVTKIYWVLNNLTDFPKCANPYCNNLIGVKRNVKLSENHRYKECCSKKCGYENPTRLLKTKLTNLKKYGVENPSQSEEIKNKKQKTSLKKFGVKNPAQSIEIKEKMRKTHLKRYGVEYYAQTTECSKNRRTIHEFDNLFFDSKAELEFYKKCKELNFDIKQSDKKLVYYHKNKKLYYHPDFEVNRFLVEIKGNHFFRINESNKEEMFCPFRNKNMSDEEYEELCEVYNAKYECMLANDVLIIKSSEVENFDYELINKI